MGKVYTRFQTKRRKNPTRWGDTYLYGLYKGVPLPPGSFPYIRVGKVSYVIFPSRTLFGTQQVIGVKCIQFSLHPGEWILIFPLVLYSARSRLGLNGVQFFLLHDTEKLTYSILHLATRYSARSRRVALQRTFVFDQFK